MSAYNFEIGLDLHKYFSMLALVDAQGQCVRYVRLENDPVQFDHYFSQINGSFRVTFESTRRGNTDSAHVQSAVKDQSCNAPATQPQQVVLLNDQQSYFLLD